MQQKSINDRKHCRNLEIFNIVKVAPIPLLYRLRWIMMPMHISGIVQDGIPLTLSMVDGCRTVEYSGSLGPYSYLYSQTTGTSSIDIDSYILSLVHIDIGSGGVYKEGARPYRFADLVPCNRPGPSLVVSVLVYCPRAAANLIHYEVLDISSSRPWCRCTGTHYLSGMPMSSASASLAMRVHPLTE